MWPQEVWLPARMLCSTKRSCLSKLPCTKTASLVLPRLWSGIFLPAARCQTAWNPSATAWTKRGRSQLNLSLLMWLWVSYSASLCLRIIRQRTGDGICFGGCSENSGTTCKAFRKVVPGTWGAFRICDYHYFLGGNLVNQQPSFKLASYAVWVRKTMWGLCPSLQDIYISPCIIIYIYKDNNPCPYCGNFTKENPLLEALLSGQMPLPKWQSLHDPVDLLKLTEWPRLTLMERSVCDYRGDRCCVKSDSSFLFVPDTGPPLPFAPFSSFDWVSWPRPRALLILILSDPHPLSRHLSVSREVCSCTSFNPHLHKFRISLSVITRWLFFPY